MAQTIGRPITNGLGTKTGTSDNFIPRDYDELYTYYFKGSGSLANRLIRSQIKFTGDASDMREDMVQDAFVKLMHMDILERFDPNKANFGGMIFCAIRSIVGNYMGKRTRDSQTGLKGGVIEETQSDSEEFEVGMFSLDRMFATEDPTTKPQAIDARRRLNGLVSVLEARKNCPQNKRDQNLLPLLELMSEGFEPLECAAKLGVTNGTIHNWMKYLRTLVPAS